MELGRFLNSRKQCARSSFHVSAQSGRDRSASNSARRRREGADRSATVEQNDRNQATDDGRLGRFDAATRRDRGTEEEGRSRPRCAAPRQVEPLCPLMPRLEPPARVTLHESVQIPLVASVWRLASETTRGSIQSLI